MMKVLMLLMLATVATAQNKDLVDTLVDLGCSQTVALVQRAGLEDVIRNGDFTVFAPTDAAWDALPDYIRRVIVGAPEYLAQVLTYHVTVARVMSGDLSNELTVPSVEGSLIRANIYRNARLVTVTGSPVSTVDVMASNGIVHLIDRVMFPIPRGRIMEDIAFDPDLTTLKSLVETARLATLLLSSGPFTLFAPTNGAFAQVPQEILDDLLANPDKLRTVLLYHIIGSTNWSVSLQNGNVPTLAGQDVEINVSSSGVRVNDATVEFADAGSSNGVIHYVNKVLLPQL